MSPLVSMLCSGQHPVEASLRPERSVSALRQRIEQGFVQIAFTGTRGGTELGVTLDREACDVTSADFDRGRGRITLCGRLTLDYVTVQCIAEIDLATLAGTGSLRVLHEAPPTDA